MLYDKVYQHLIIILSIKSYQSLESVSFDQNSKYL